MPSLDVRAIRNQASGDQYSDWVDGFDHQGAGEPGEPENPLDNEENRKMHRQLLGWLYLEKDKQAENRLEMALDADFYDSLQWNPEDAQVLKDRGQMPLVYNEIAPMVDWLIGTERRAKVDWSVLPRTEDDVDIAEVKTQTLKYVSDINRVPHTRSTAFADAIKVGVGWLDDGVRDDPTQDPLYSRYEDWRNVLWDSCAIEQDLSDARYIFRWRWVDEDIALHLFPDRADHIRRAAEEAGTLRESDEPLYYLGERIDVARGMVHATGSGVMFDAQRRRVKLIECQYRQPVKAQVVMSGPMKGAFLHPEDEVMRNHVQMSGASIEARRTLQVHIAIFTEGALLRNAPSVMRHNRFTLTPVWCYRRGRDRLPYGVVRRVRDVQQDLNKRASKALFLMNTNQIIADEGATDDWENLRDEADRPDGMIIKKAGKELTIRRDSEQAVGQINMMQMDAQSIQRSAGVNNENLGRSTNAVSEVAIRARQLQGSVGTTEPFDNLRFAVQVQGEKQLSHTEQFYTQDKVMRLTGARGAFEWVKINQPEVQTDGSVRYINDITASMADFKVADSDYSGTLRQAMYESFEELAAKFPPELALRIFTIGVQYSDMPNKDEVADAIRAITGEKDPNKKLSPEEQKQALEQQNAQVEALQMQRDSAMLALQEQRAKIAKLQAEAQAIMAGPTQDDGPANELRGEIGKVQAQASQQIDQLSEQLRKAQSDSATKTLQISRDADTKLETARIDADAKVRVAEIQAASDKHIAALEARLAKLVDGLAKRVEEVKAIAQEKPEPVKAEPKPTPTPPTTINIAVDAKSGAVKKTIELVKDKNGNTTGAEVNETEA